MADKPLAGRVIAVMLANGFDEIEFTEPAFWLALMLVTLAL